MYIKYMDDWGIVVAVITKKDEVWAGKAKIRTIKKLVENSLNAIQPYKSDYFFAEKFVNESVLAWIEESDEEKAHYKIIIQMQYILESYKEWREIWLFKE